jgi:hypothetical protein
VRRQGRREGDDHRRRDNALITAYNAAIDEHNAILESECELE